MWLVSGFVMTTITLSMGELASAYPVAGAMASWAWKCARGGVRRERYWGWLVNGFTMGFHIAVVS
jgi:amino acid transporter